MTELLIYYNILLCELSYKNPEELSLLYNTSNKYNIIKPFINNQIFINDIETDTQLYLWYNNNILFISFRGTSSIKDTLIDLQIKQKKYKDGIKIHTGFYKQYISVQEKINKFIDNNDISIIYISGHSLGGAVASIASAIIAEKYNNIKVSCFTYGSPRVGNKKFKKYFKKHVNFYYRIQLQDDPIPMLPMNCKYYHVCKAINISEDDKVSITNDKKWYKRFINCITTINYIDLFRDHHTYIYIDKIKKNIL